MTDEVAGDLQEGVEARQQQMDGSSSDEYDPQAVQTDYISPPRAKDSSVQSFSLDTFVPNILPHTSAVPLDPTSSSTKFPLVDHATLDRQSLSRSMSRASSQSSDEVDITTTQQEPGQAPSKDTEVTAAENSGGSDSADMAHNTSLDPVSDSSLNASTNAVSPHVVQIQNDVQDQNPPDSAQNRVANTVPNLAAVIPDTGASFHSEATAKPTETLPAPTVTNTNPPVVTIPPTPTTTAPRARLPHDKIGILEDRIKEDTRGDLDAWLNLIDEHKKRGKFDDARAVYERFLAVFPSAVYPTPYRVTMYTSLLIMPYRQSNGSPTGKWRTSLEKQMQWTMFSFELYRRIHTSHCGLYILTISAATITSPQTPRAMPVMLSIRRTMLP